MKEISVIDSPALYRDNYRVRGFVFGSGKKSVCVVGPMRGNEYQQQFIAARLVSRLKEIESKGELVDGYEILVLPCANTYSFNTRKRFWPINNFDINRSFPGEVDGASTERFAGKILQMTKNYQYGIQLSSYYISGTFMPHIKIFKTELNCEQSAKDFKMPFVQVRSARAFEKTTLNYNWQMNGVQGFSLYSSATNYIDKNSAHTVLRSILLFLKARGIITSDIPGGYETKIINSQTDLMALRAPSAGFFSPKVKVGFEVSAGDLLAEIRDPYTDEVVSTIVSPKDGTIFYMQSDPLTYSHSSVFNLILR